MTQPPRLLSVARHTDSDSASDFTGKTSLAAPISYFRVFGQQFSSMDVTGIVTMDAGMHTHPSPEWRSGWKSSTRTLPTTAEARKHCVTLAGEFLSYGSVKHKTKLLCKVVLLVTCAKMDRLYHSRLHRNHEFTQSQKSGLVTSLRFGNSIPFNMNNISHLAP